MKKLRVIFKVAIVAIATAVMLPANSTAQVSYPYTIEQDVNFRVNVRSYKMFYGLVPGNSSPEGYTYQKWGYTGSYSQKNGYIGLPNDSDQKYIELTVWFHNIGDKEAKIYFSSNDSTLLDCSLLFGDNQSIPARAFNIPGAGVGANRMMIEEWKGDLYFTLKPQEETWIMILFRIPEDVSEAKFRLKQHALIPVSIPEREH
ncbi:MAG: hypothetical protein LBL90_06280 [Prevotellaceae bacterium]|jgi:hypothetical protein|nr:hypothetical protein [Prevotellaceae bacterium]